MPEFLAAAPQAGRILRPLCHMLGIALPAILQLPAPPPRRKPVKPPRPKPAPLPPLLPLHPQRRPRPLPFIDVLRKNRPG